MILRSAACSSLAIAVLLTGCNQTPKVAQITPAGVQSTAKMEKEPETIIKRQPKPSTCVAFGLAAEAAAEQQNLPRMQKDQLYDQSRKAYQQALKDDPKSREAILALARLYAKTGDHPRAVAAYNRGIEQNPKDAAIWHELGMCQARQKDWKSSLDSLYQAVRLDPENKALNQAYGYALARAGHHEESVQAFARLSDEATAHYNVARMCKHLEQPDLCKQHLQLALAKNANHEDAKVLLASFERPAAGSEELAQQPPQSK